MLQAIDFFCGGGGMTCGLRQAGIDVIAGIDIDENCKETYEYNNQNCRFISADIQKLDIKFFERKVGVQRNDDRMIFAGCSPCQYYSIINTDKSKSLKSKDLLSDFSKFIAYYNPGYILVENVPGIISNKNSIFPQFLYFLYQHKYEVHKKIVDLSYYGVPQTRKRFSLIASRLGNTLCMPEKDEKQSILKNFIGTDNGFPVLSAGNTDKSPSNHSVASLSKICLERIKVTPKNGGSRLAWKNNPTLQLPCFIGKDNSFVDTFGRMSWDKPASTITTKFYSISNGRFAHPEEDRAISIREGAALQTFPLSYEFRTKSLAATARLIGNAVPPEYARRLGEAIIRSFEQ